MGLLQYGNFAISPLAINVDSDDTVMTLQGANSFPSTGDYYIRIDDEIMRCTARSGNNLTVVRGEQSTTAVAHTIGAACYQIVTPYDFSRFNHHRNTYANRPSSLGIHDEQNVFFASNSPIESYWDGTQWHSRIHKHNVKPLVDTGFTWLNQGGSSLTTTAGYTDAFLLGALTNQFRGRYTTAPTPPYTWTVFIGDVLNLTSSNIKGMFLRDNSGKLIIYGVTHEGILRIQKFDSVTSFNSNYTMAQNWYIGFINSTGFWLRIVDDNTNRNYQFSIDGYNWFTIHTTTNTDFLTQNFIGYGGTSASNLAIRMQVFSWEVN